MKNEKLKQQIIAYALLVLGSALFAIGDVMFVNPYHLAPGGVYGLANVFNALWGWKISVSGIAMDIPLLIIGTIILGPKFGIKTIISVILIPVFTYILETWWGYAPLIHDGAFFDTEMQSSLFFLEGDVQRYFMPDFFLNTIVSGLIYGVAIGVIFRAGATSGGSDIISMIIHKYTKISLGTLVMVVDSIISLTTLIAFEDIRLPQQKASSRKWGWVIGIAASVAILLAVGTTLHTRNSKDECVAYIYGEKCTDKTIVMQHMQSALDEMEDVSTIDEQMRDFFSE